MSDTERISKSSDSGSSRPFEPYKTRPEAATFASDRKPMLFRKAENGRGPLTIAVLVVALVVLHQDNWYWTDDSLVAGFMPVGLFYHSCLSVAASAVWLLACKVAWPIDDDQRGQI